MENNLPTIKIFKIDYSFLIKNYLNPELWDKKWTLFIYKNYEITLNIYKILTKERKICFEINLFKHDINSKYNDCNVSYTIECSLKIEDLTFMKRQINSAIFNCMVNMERLYLIRTLQEYKDLEEQRYEEQYRLRQYANDFLDECGVTSNACREAYIDAYVDENEQIYDLMDRYETEQIYKLYPDFYIVFLNSLEDDPKKEIRLKEIERKLTNDELEQIKKEIEDFNILFEDEEEFEKELKSKLGDI